ncbi:hypothetical protein ACHQM5_023232 [Ranunculus cassubicifolius]
MAKSKTVAKQQQSEAVPAAAANGLAKKQQVVQKKEEAVEKIKGNVKWFNAEKKYGFIVFGEIVKDELDQEVCVERQVLVLKDYVLPDKSGGEVVLQDGEKVEFVMSTGLDGKPVAVNVKVLRRPQQQQRRQQQFDSNGGSGDGQCYNCNGVGHMARDCEGACYKCNVHGHKPWECPGRACYTCGKPGHRARECQENPAAA